jgi:adenylate cyclase
VSLSSSIAEHRPARTAAALTCAAWLVAYACFWAWPTLFGGWDARASDYLFRLRTRLQCPVMPCRDRVVHVDLTYSGLRRMGNRQLTRTQFARVVDNLAAFGVTAQLFDIVFALQTTPEDDAALVRAAKAAGTTYFGLVLLTEPPKVEFDEASQLDDFVRSAAWDVQMEGPAESIAEGFAPVPTFEALAKAARGVGFLNLAADGDGVFRRVPLIFRFRGRVFPSLSLRVACDYLGVPPHDVVVTPGRSIRLRGARLPGAATATDVVIPIGRDGRYRVNYAGPWEAFRHESLQGVFRANNDPVASVLLTESLNGRIAIVADISTGGADVGPVPTDERYPLPGVHATIVDNILAASFVRDPSPPLVLALELSLALAVALTSWRMPPRGIAAGAALLAVFYLSAVTAAFLYLHVILNIVRPMFALAIAAVSVGTYRFLKESEARAVLRQTFQAYFPPAVVDRIVGNPGLVTAAGEKKELSILFSDIKGFTTRCEGMTPDEVRAFLNVYFATMVDVAFEHGGTVDKFIGDGLMVFFGDPDDQPDHAVRAVQTALAMQQEVRKLSAQLERDGADRFQIRIGISTGVVMVGNMGSPRRLSYTVLGADVNLAQRLESNAPPGGILISDRTHALLPAGIQTVSAGTIPIKGMAHAVPVHEVVVFPEPPPV